MMIESEKKMEKLINDYLEHLTNDYHGWCDKAKISLTAQDRKYTFSEGRNYYKIIHLMSNGQRSVHSFVVKKATKKFGVGAILKAAGWNAPATNFARGTIYDANTYETHRWSGI